MREITTSQPVKRSSERIYREKENEEAQGKRQLKGNRLS